MIDIPRLLDVFGEVCPMCKSEDVDWHFFETAQQGEQVFVTWQCNYCEHCYTTEHIRSVLIRES